MRGAPGWRRRGRHPCRAGRGHRRVPCRSACRRPGTGRAAGRAAALPAARSAPQTDASGAQIQARPGPGPGPGPSAGSGSRAGRAVGIRAPGRRVQRGSAGPGVRRAGPGSGVRSWTGSGARPRASPGSGRRSQPGPGSDPVPGPRAWRGAPRQHRAPGADRRPVRGGAPNPWHGAQPARRDYRPSAAAVEAAPRFQGSRTAGWLRRRAAPRQACTWGAVRPPARPRNSPAGALPGTGTPSSAPQATGVPAPVPGGYPAPGAACAPRR